MFKKCLKLSIILLSIVLIVACKKEEEKKQVLKIGIMPIPYQNAISKYVKPALEKEGITLEVVEFNDYNTPNLSLNDGSIDVNAFQHQQFLDRFNVTHGTKIVSVGITTLSPIGYYSKKITNIDDLKDGDRIAIPNDPSNEGRVLLILQNQAKLIKLKDDVNINSITPKDIVENPKQIEFVELDAAQLPRVIDDFTIVVMNGNYALNAGYNPVKDPILVEDVASSPYINIFATKEERKNDVNIKKLIKAFQTKEVAEIILQETKGGIVPGWKY
ncbi:MAG: MetQ/NlpA family ABC transporter substrate-binding protein [Rickettsiales bacterium]|jgi:D-methionine transport system substrate-binding protein|nr:MetQ/NlpA family ABC transporter substrate-binding protein [Rickettsiales bacterium]